MQMNEDQILNAIITDDAVSDLSLKHSWVDRAISNKKRTKDNESIRTAVEVHPELGWMVFPTIRLEGEELKHYSLEEAMNIAIENKDFVSVPSLKAGQALSHGLSNYLGGMDNNVRRYN